MAVEGNELLIQLPGGEPELASLALPPIDRLPPGHVRRNVLAEFARKGTLPWGGVAGSLTAAVSRVLWTILVLNVAFGTWLLAVRGGAAPCSGIVCTAATLGGHPLLALVSTAVCAGALVASVPMTRGLSRANGPQLALVVVGALSGVVALAGVFAVFAVAALSLVVAFGVFVFVVDRL
jgi:hypothetical protein